MNNLSSLNFYKSDNYGGEISCMKSTWDKSLKALFIRTWLKAKEKPISLPGDREVKALMSKDGKRRLLLITPRVEIDEEIEALINEETSEAEARENERRIYRAEHSSVDNPF